MNNDLGFRQWRKQNGSRCERWHANAPWSLSDWTTAAAGELGEAANMIKKLNRHRDGIPEKIPAADLARDALTEIADAIAYLEILAAELVEIHGLDVDLAEAITIKFNQVSEREGWPERLPPISHGGAGND